MDDKLLIIAATNKAEHYSRHRCLGNNFVGADHLS